LPSFASMHLDWSLDPRLPRVDPIQQPIYGLVQLLEASCGVRHSVFALCQRYGLERRSVYDMFNIFVAVGCCSKNSLDFVVWYGRGAAQWVLVAARDERRVLDPRLTLVELFPASRI